jgi:hypothetical protein
VQEKSLRDELLALDGRRKEMEDQMQQLVEALTNDGVGVSGGLIDGGGLTCVCVCVVVYLD